MRPGHEKRVTDAERVAKALSAREWREQNADRVRAYRDENKAQAATQARVWRYRKRVAAHLIETDTVSVLHAALNERTHRNVDPLELISFWADAEITNTCYRGCGRGWREIVHRVPLYAGGDHDVTNLVPVCGRC
ncbi:hypothetical protein TR51_25625 [Kitasatospora griseola]|uniref:HNH nuclease domain-containing protein n=1 Tax=Kitasatospora griseola TaxID=2064 RepID=A0A0D0N2X1_KITGR|nr:HNH endonuclease signature motif containing protein [Kitasatospora griseola]KIQ62420.1 hypothetical protein TR51_25625 [Kitasatospora griseola]